MNIRMIGIDHSRASLEERELFSFTKKKTAQWIRQLKASEGIRGCLLISTCNRMELWLSCTDAYDASLEALLCKEKGVELHLHNRCFVLREGMEAITHLFYLTCGMKSKIMGEDQILTQVKDALAFSREHYCTDNILETLFRMAVTAAKEVKTKVHPNRANASVIDCALEMLERKGETIKDKRCLVIGNGQMGKCAALAMKEKGAEVTITVRQYRSGVVEIPKGCSRIHYGDRYQNMDDYHVIVSATSSPNMTLNYEELSQINLKYPMILLDLAVPRDIDPNVRGIHGMTLYDIDDFAMELVAEEKSGLMKQMDDILGAYIHDFLLWQEGRYLVPSILAFGECAANDVGMRVKKTIRNAELAHEEKELLTTTVHAATNKVVSKLMFDLREHVSPAAYKECVEALKYIYE